MNKKQKKFAHYAQKFPLYSLIKAKYVHYLHYFLYIIMERKIQNVTIFLTVTASRVGELQIGLDSVFFFLSRLILV